VGQLVKRKTSQSEMPSSASFRQRCRDRLHQTPIEAQPSRSDGAGRWARGPRNDFVPSCRPIQRVDSWIRRPQSVVCGLGGGAEQSSSILRDPDLKTERERASNHREKLPGPYPWILGALAGAWACLNRDPFLVRPSWLELGGGLTHSPPFLRWIELSRSSRKGSTLIPQLW
jgi:hypothetical protein